MVLTVLGLKESHGTSRTTFLSWALIRIMQGRGLQVTPKASLQVILL